LVGRVGKVLPEAAPELDVDQLVAVAHLPSQDPLLPPAVVDDRLLGGLVGRRDAAVDLVRAELLEGLQVGEALSLAPDPLALDSLVSHDRPELGRRLTTQSVERRVADRIVDPLDLDGPFAVLRVRVLGLLNRALDPTARVLLAEGIAMLEQVRRRGRTVEPAVDGGGVPRPEVSERNSARHQRRSPD